MNSIEYFNGIAAKWNVIRSEYFEEKLKYKVLSKAYIDNKIVGDLGCGTGFISMELAKKSKLVFSVDNSVNMLKELKNSVIKENLNNVYPMRSSLESITLFDESLDAVFMNMALHHVKNPDKAIEEINRILKRNGTIVISDVMEHNGEWAREEMFDEWLGFSNSQIDRWLRDSNFKNINIENTDLTCKGYSSKGEFTETGIFIACATKV